MRTLVRKRAADHPLVISDDAYFFVACAFDERGLPQPVDDGARCLYDLLRTATMSMMGAGCSFPGVG